VVAVASGKGGVGKTSLAVNLALAFSATQLDTLLVDADLSFANADVMLGVDSPATLDAVLAGVSRQESATASQGEVSSLEQLLVRGPAGLDLLPGVSGSLELANLDRDRAAAIARQVHALARERDILLFDTGAGLSALTVEVAALADVVLLVLTAEPTAFMGAYGMLKVLQRSAPRTRVQILVNRARDAAEAAATAERFRCVAVRFLGTTPEIAGWVPEDSSVHTAIRSQAAFLLECPETPAACALRDLAAGFSLSASAHRGRDHCVEPPSRMVAP
jgi:flagellar biosynthesis protein FlhG